MSEIFDFFVIKHPQFPYEKSTFRTLVPKNLVAPTLRDVKRNVCPIYENVDRAIKAFNQFVRKNKVKELSLPSSTLDICLLMVCIPHRDDATSNWNPLNWSPLCTEGDCESCGGEDWYKELLRQIKDKDMGKKSITFSRWVSEKGSDGKKKQILKQESLALDDFVKKILFESLVEESFPEHLRKAWNQWEITKKPLRVIPAQPTDVGIHTHEDYQQDVKFLCSSETVSTHRGHGVIPMLCYPVVLEVFKADSTKELYGLIFLSDSKNKNFDTVNYFQEATINFVKSKGYTITRYDRITDGCSSQFWCYGTMRSPIGYAETC